MRLEQLEHIIEIEKQKSISKAAKALYMGQSSLSCSLTSLEDELGVKLFERTTSGVVPTGEGQKALQLAHQMLDLKKQLFGLSEDETELQGTVTLLVGQAYGYYLKDIMLNFKRRHPKAELILQVGTPEQVVYSLLKGSNHVTLALLVDKYKEKILNMKNRNLCSVTFGKYPFWVFAKKDGKYAERTTITLDELQKEQILLNCNETWDVVFPDFKLEKECFVVSDRDFLRQLIVNEDGVALLPAMFAQKAIQPERDLITALKIESPVNLPEVEALLLYPDKRGLTRLEQSLVAVIKEVVQKELSA
ncbi:MAG: LysR family transcriptional regulator [Peptococcaceae bacterium]|nr:LysR family transcriptional regulator [Peptococcaceae bacterium]MBO5366688.1 LysR family transcriptional regulator [Peptococcaceae bacterium]MBP3341053.1 LysR family transcriptional regulator [Peptococcaceae bacterium]MBP3585502.1 LysR family transcriptional regulator [Peptococcaceae bacterium]